MFIFKIIINSVLILFVEVEVDAAVATAHMMVCGCSGAVA